MEAFHKRTSAKTMSEDEFANMCEMQFGNIGF